MAAAAAAAAVAVVRPWVLLDQLEAQRMEAKVVFDEKRGGYTRDTTLFRGVIGLMQSHFYPTYVYAPPATPVADPYAIDVASLTGRSTDYTGVGETKQVAVAAAAAAVAVVGRDLGILIDQQVYNAVEAIHRERTTIMGFLKKRQIAATGAYRDLHSRTVHVLRALAVRKWLPLAAQLPVCHSKTRIATMVDLVCWDEANKRYILLDVKSGFTRGYDTGKNKMSAPFQKQMDSQYNQHQLQLLATTLLFKHTFNLTSKQVCSGLLRVDDHCVHVHPQEQWAIKGSAYLPMYN